MTRPPVGSTGTLAELQVEAGDVVQFRYPGSKPGELRTVAKVISGDYYMTDSQHWAVVKDPYWTLISRANPDQPEKWEVGEFWPNKHIADGVVRKLLKDNPTATAGDDQPAHIITHEGREYDLTALETPPALLPDEVYDALVKWRHGLIYFAGGRWNERDAPPSRDYGLVVRAKPAPAEARVWCAIMEIGGLRASEHGTCIKNPDGSIDWASWEPDA